MKERVTKSFLPLAVLALLSACVPAPFTAVFPSCQAPQVAPASPGAP